MRQLLNRSVSGFGKTRIWVYDIDYTGLSVGMLSATASLGLLYLWDPVDSINQIDQFIYAEDLNIQVSPFRSLICNFR